MRDFVARLKDSVVRPSGSMPTRPSKLVLTAVLLFIGAVLFFGTSGARSPRVAVADPRLTASSVDEGRIQQLKVQLGKAEQQLRNTEAILKQAKRREEIPDVLEHRTDFSRPPQMTTGPADRASERGERERQERRASNVVFSNRQPPRSAEPRSIPAISISEQRSEEIVGHPSGHTLYEGTLLEASLTNRLDGSFTGPVNCIVTSSVYSADRQNLLIPQGARLLGSADRVSAFGQERLAISFHRLVMPNGWSTTLKDDFGLNEIGEAGLKDKTDHHLIRLLGTSAAVGVLGGVSLSGTNYGVYTSGEDRVLQSTIGATAGSITRILDRYLNVLPTVSIREGHRVRVYLRRDLSLPAYTEAEL